MKQLVLRQRKLTDLQMTNQVEKRDGPICKISTEKGDTETVSPELQRIISNTIMNNSMLIN